MLYECRILKFGISGNRRISEAECIVGVLRETPDAI